MLHTAETSGINGTTAKILEEKSINYKREVQSEDIERLYPIQSAAFCTKPVNTAPPNTHPCSTIFVKTCEDVYSNILPNTQP